MAETKPKVLFIDDEEDLLRTIAIVLKKSFDISTADSGIKGLSLAESSAFDVVVCDISMPEVSGMEVLKRLKKHDPAIEVIMLTALNDTQLALQAAKEGAYDFLTKPFDPEAIRITIERAYEKKCLIAENQKLKSRISLISEQSFANIIGTSPMIKAVFELIQKVSRNDSSVLIHGETGTGKELIARAIHNLSGRKDGPFITVNCGAVPRELFESEFFGYEKGAFTGAIASRIGKFEAADGGTLFLDEIATLPLDMQIKLLRVLQEREVCKIGTTKPVPFDVRIVSACNEDLKQKIAKGEFREDLYHRIAVVPIQVPPLRKRQDDIKLLAYYFLDKFNKKYHKEFSLIEDDALDVLNNYYWPGNVRELEHLFERIISLEDGPVLKSSYLPLEMFLSKVPENMEESTFKKLVSEFERNLVLAALKKTGNNQSKAAQLLGISRTTFISKMEVLDIAIS